jgi:hypothetical protein
VSHAESRKATALQRWGWVRHEKRFVTGQTAGGHGTGPPGGRSGPSRIALGNSWKTVSLAGRTFIAHLLDRFKGRGARQVRTLRFLEEQWQQKVDQGYSCKPNIVSPELNTKWVTHYKPLNQIVSERASKTH